MRVALDHDPRAQVADRVRVEPAQVRQHVRVGAAQFPGAWLQCDDAGMHPGGDFVGERDFRDFLGRYLPAREGEIRDPQGHVLGTHPGVFYFTLGQRGGLQLGGVRGRGEAPWYVVGKDVAGNILYVDQGHDSPWLQSTIVRTEAAHWISGDAPGRCFASAAQVRYRQHEEPCDVEMMEDGTLRVRFARAQRAVTPGQSLVLYDGERCLGGAVIASTDAPLQQQARERAA